jgi:hypothetical protein
MWDGDEKPFEGKHYQLARPLNSPRPVQKPHPPILIGGSGERKTLRLVAQYGDGCNLFARLGDDVLKHKLNVLRDHCQSLGRPYEDIEKTTLNVMQLSRDGRNGTMSPAAAIEHFANLASMGISTSQPVQRGSHKHFANLSIVTRCSGLRRQINTDSQIFITILLLESQSFYLNATGFIIQLDVKKVQA